MATPTNLEQKYLILDAYFPGIQPRRMSQSRYLEKKSEARHVAKLLHDRKPSLPSLCGLKHVNASLSFAQKSIEHTPSIHINGVLRPRTRCQVKSLDLSIGCHGEKSRVVIGVAGYWDKKIETVEKTLINFDQVCRRASKQSLPLFSQTTVGQRRSL